MERLKLLLTPSLSSGTFCFGLAALILGAAGWSYIEDSQLFYGYIFGAYGLKTALIQAPDELWTLSSAIAGSGITYYILVLMCGIMAGLTTYTILEAVNHLKRNANEVVHNMQSYKAANRRAAQESFLRLGLRVVSIIAWAIYTIVFAAMLLPFCILWIQIGIDRISLGMVVGWPTIIGSWIMLGLALHAHVILARLVWLRPRLFGDSAIEEAEA